MKTVPHAKPHAASFHLALLLAALLLAACQPLSTPPPLVTPAPTLTPTVNVPPTATPPATATPTITPQPPAGAISGVIWHDLCEPGKDGQPPPVEPPAGCVRAPDGTYRANGLFDGGEPRLGGVKVRLGAGPCPSPGLAETLASADAGYSFVGLPAGTYCVSVDASLEPNFSLLTPGNWTYPALDTAIAAGSQTVTLGADESKSGVNFGWDYQFLPNNPCVYRAAFVADVTIPDNTTINAGQSFVKTWRVRNTGTCAWGPGYPVNALVFSGGVNLAGVDRVAIPSVVAAGATVDLSISMTAPDAAGTQRSEWKLALDSGGLLGVGATADQPLFAQIVVPQRATATPTAVKPVIQAFGIAPSRVRRGDPVTLTWATTNAQDVFIWRLDDRGRLAEPNGIRVPASGSRVMDMNDPLNRTYSFFLSATTAGQTTSATARPEIICETAADARCAAVNWRGEYFNNRNLSGSPVTVRDDATLDFNWGLGAPLPNFPADSFSVRWTRSLAFNQGTYRFRALADDGVRVWVDEQLVIDDWRDGGAGEVTGEVSLAAGNHSLRVEFYENAGDANFRLTWEVVGSPSFPDWKGEYWNNRTFSGAPVLVRNDRNVDFDWGNNAPAAGLPADDFSVRWSRWITFEPGVYRFTVNADDGVRVYVDGQLILDEWREQDINRTFTVERALNGPRPVTVEYFERAGLAAVKVRWERLPNTPTPTPTTAMP